MSNRLAPLLQAALQAQASDLHLEPGQPMALRVRGQLKLQGEAVPPRETQAIARELLGDELWPAFLERRSADLARTLLGARCRINLLCTSRGIGLAIRFLHSSAATLSALNLHPGLARLIEPHHGLLIVSGATGSGKSSTMAALIQELNAKERRHILTLEQPIEYLLAPRTSFIRQREVGRDTPSFEQGLYDAMREDPDVLMVGELRDAETMRLTLNAAETGHLVLTTLHSATAAEALQRLVLAFPAEIQSGISAQLADCLAGVICQRLRYFPERGMRAPECEVLIPTHGVRAVIRSGQFAKIQTALETGGGEGSFTFSRYREWLEKKTDWHAPAPIPLEKELSAIDPGEPLLGFAKRAAPARIAPAAMKSAPGKHAMIEAPDKRASAPESAPVKAQVREDGVLEIQSGGDLDAILSELEEK